MLDTGPYTNEITVRCSNIHCKQHVGYGGYSYSILKKYCISRKFHTVKPVQNDHSKIDKTKVLLTNGSLMQVKSIAECSPWSILQYF